MHPQPIQMALLWKLTGNVDYANAIKVMNDWADKCKGITSNDANQTLATGVQGYTFANAAELCRLTITGRIKDKWTSNNGSLDNHFHPRILNFLKKNTEAIGDLLNLLV